jgi:hypothetical protein
MATIFLWKHQAVESSATLKEETAIPVVGEAQFKKESLLSGRGLLSPS